MKRMGVVLSLVVFAVALYAPAAWAIWDPDGNPVSTAVEDQVHQQIVAVSSGGWIAVWIDLRDGVEGDIYAQRFSVLGDPMWTTDGVPICTAVLPQGDPQIVADCCGGAIIVWDDLRTGIAQKIYAQRISAEGNVLWTPDGVPVCTETGNQAYARLASDDQGGAFVTWVDGRSGSDIYVQYVNSTGGPAWISSGVPVCTDASVQRRPEITTDNVGYPVMVWEDDRNGTTDVYAQRIDPGNGAPQWTVDGVAVCTAAGLQLFPEIIRGDFVLASLVVVWRDGRGADWDVYAQRISPAGSMMWAADGVPVCAVAGDQSAPSVVAVPSAVIVAFEDRRANPYWDIYAQKLGESGTEQWTAGGVAVCVDTLDQGNPSPGEAVEMVSDGASGAVITWYDERAGLTDVNIYAQRLASDGSPVWQANGVGACLASGIQQSPRLAPDGTGGAAFVWVDLRDALTTGRDLYAQRLLGTGQRGSAEPEILGVIDVPRDQGGKIQIQWTASAFDVPPSSDIVYYSLWRGVPLITPALRAAAPALGDLPVMGEDFTGTAVRRVATDWAAEWIANIPARNFEVYAYTAVSLYDSMGTDPGWQYFMVSAQTAEQMVFYDSPIDSGYSVDNLSPAVPQGLAGTQTVGPAGLTLEWDANTEHDLSHYAVYRGTTAGFVPGPGNLLGSPATPLLTDEEWVWDSGYYYKVSAVDVHGNESGYAVLAPENITGVGNGGPPKATFLAQNHPNPFSGATDIAFGLHAGADVHIRIYDVQGRLVRDLVDRRFAADRHVINWDGRDDRGHTVAGGVYFYRLDAGTFTQTRKMVLMR